MGFIWDTFRTSFWYPFWRTFGGVYAPLGCQGFFFDVCLLDCFRGLSQEQPVRDCTVGVHGSETDPPVTGDTKTYMFEDSQFIRAQTMDLSPNDPSNEDPMETYKSVWWAQNDCLTTPEYVFGGSSSQPAFRPHYSTPKQSQNNDV